MRDISIRLLLVVREVLEELQSYVLRLTVLLRLCVARIIAPVFIMLPLPEVTHASTVTARVVRKLTVGIEVPAAEVLAEAVPPKVEPITERPEVRVCIGGKQLVVLCAHEPEFGGHFLDFREVLVRVAPSSHFVGGDTRAFPFVYELREMQERAEAETLVEHGVTEDLLRDIDKSARHFVVRKILRLGGVFEARVPLVEYDFKHLHPQHSILISHDVCLGKLSLGLNLLGRFYIVLDTDVRVLLLL